MTDIVERLRESAKIAWGYPGMLPWPEHGSPLPNEAADTIEALRAENARLREALKPFADKAEYFDNYIGSEAIGILVTVEWLRAARVAMGETE